MDNKTYELLEEALEMLCQAKESLIVEDRLDKILYGYIDKSIKDVNSDIHFLKSMPKNKEIVLPDSLTNKYK